MGSVTLYMPSRAVFGDLFPTNGVIFPTGGIARYIKPPPA